MPLFGGKHKTPHELLKVIRDGLVVLGSTDVKDEKKIQKVTRLHSLIKNSIPIPIGQFLKLYSKKCLAYLYCGRGVDWYSCGSSGGMEPVAMLRSQLSTHGQFQDVFEDIFDVHC